MPSSVRCADDGWAIASHIALSTLMSLFPFLIFVTALDRLPVRHRGTCRSGGGPAAGGLAQGGGGADRPRVANVLTTAHGGAADLRRGSGALFLLERHREPAHRPQPRLRRDRDAAVVGAAAGIDRLCAGRRRGADHAVLPHRAGTADLPRGAALMRPGSPASRRCSPSPGSASPPWCSWSRWCSCTNGCRSATGGFVEIAPGIFVTLAGWIVLGVAFGRYLAQFSGAYVTTYAGLASAMIALVFLYWTRGNFRLWRRIQPGDPQGPGGGAKPALTIQPGRRASGGFGRPTLNEAADLFCLARWRNLRRDRGLSSRSEAMSIKRDDIDTQKVDFTDVASGLGCRRSTAAKFLARNSRRRCASAFTNAPRQSRCPAHAPMIS